jgi:hypothetical protein
VKTNLCRHYTLSLRNKVALGTDAILETTLPLVALQPANHTVIPAAGAFGAPGAFLSSRVAGGARLGLQQTPGCGACSWTQHPAISYDIPTVVKVCQKEYNITMKSSPTAEIKPTISKQKADYWLVIYRSLKRTKMLGYSLAFGIR